MARPLRTRLNPDVLAAAPDVFAALDEALGAGGLDRLVARAERTPGPEHARLAVLAVLRLLGDLQAHGWTFRYATDGTLSAWPFEPTPTATEKGVDARRAVKDQLRRTGEHARALQLGEDDVARRVFDLERRGVRKLFALPADLARDVGAFSARPYAEQEAELAGFVQPYVEVADGRLDPTTRLRLLDVWRYARHTWSMPFNEVPGRRAYFLVRDAARPGHPVMGIGALGSCVAQLTVRDAFVGWETPALGTRREVEAAARRDGLRGPTDEVRARLFVATFGSGWGYVRRLLDALDEEVAAVYVRDFVAAGALREDELRAPTEATLARLATVETAGVPVPAGASAYERGARTALYTAKRRKKLAALLGARLVLQAYSPADMGEGSAGLDALLGRDDVRRALRTALRAVKQRYAAAAVLDITTCGAVPPYNALLGGKLTSLLMASPQVVAWARERYGRQESEIASRMKGERVVRDPSLALLTTTSLYGVGSSQYERLRVPVAHGTLAYRYVGDTEGHGSVHVSQRTHRTFAALLDAHPALSRPGNRFGEGVNARMRVNKAALSYLRLDALERHTLPRRVYAVPLVRDLTRYLTGQGAPYASIYADLDRPGEETEALVDLWRRRWLLPRLRRPETAEQVRAQAAVRVSDLVPEDARRRVGAIPEAPLFATPE